MDDSLLSADETLLAEAFGIQTAYTDVFGRRCRLQPAVLHELLRCLGVEAGSSAPAAELLQIRAEERVQQAVEPVVVIWEREQPQLKLRLPRARAARPIAAEVLTEEGVTLELQLSAVSPAVGCETFPGDVEEFVVEGLPEIPLGYHLLRLDLNQQQAESLLICAPRFFFQAPGAEPTWGVFAPLYSLTASGTEAAGSYGQLGRLSAMVSRCGGGCVGTLPVLSTFLGELFDPSPYAPVSRLFWNELYIDLETAPFADSCAELQKLISSEGFKEKTAALRSTELVDYRAAAELKRRGLELLTRFAWSCESEAAGEFTRYRTERRLLKEYARFRALTELRGEPWQHWPEEGDDDLGPDERSIYRYHCYVQWAAEKQLKQVQQRWQPDQIGLYLDFPLGVNRSGFDNYLYRDLFVDGADAGAPPDTFFTGGQNWGFAPLHPQRLRERRYDYFIAALRNHLKFAGALRIDHVMQFHRLYWIPQGVAAAEGAYLNYPWQEFYAIMALESQRHRCVIVGENLGTVPNEVTESMQRHKMWELSVLQYQMPAGDLQLRLPPERSVASLNTHDQVPFSAFCNNQDFEMFERWNLLSAEESRAEQSKRAEQLKNLRRCLNLSSSSESEHEDGRELLTAVLEWLAASPSRLVLINLQDLLFETGAQNMPGTNHEHPNWRRRLGSGLDELELSDRIVNLFGRLSRVRKMKAGSEVQDQ